jgi:hypothetical protein
MRGRESNYLKVDVGVVGERWNRWVEPARITDGTHNELDIQKKESQAGRNLLGQRNV